MRKPKATVEAARIAFEAFGVRAEVEIAPADELDRVRPLLPPGWQPCEREAVQKRFAIHPDERGTFALLKDGKPFVESLGLALALELLEAQLRAYVALHAPDRVFVHAGAVAHRGRAIVLPGMSFAGKTTLVAALVRAGATYLSDEFAPLDADGLVHPYPKPLSVRDEHEVQHDHDVSSIGGVAGDRARPIGLVVATSFSPGAQWSPRRLTPGEGLLALLSHTVAAQTRPPQVMAFLRRASESAKFLESPRDEAAALAPLLLAELEH